MAKLNNNIMRINLKKEIDDSYDIVFGENLFPAIAEELREWKLGSRYAVITDSNVRKLYADSLGSELRRKGLDFEIFSFDAGEQSKKIGTCIKIIKEMSGLRFGRDSVILALGGGVVGDMAGFIAAVFNRGVPYVQIPTTILAQADSSIGGKTAVDTEFGKNLIGAFKQPKKVYIDVSTLETLSDDEIRIGLAETVKHGIVLDNGFFDYVEKNVDKILEKDREALLHTARQNCRIKGGIVEKDPKEKALRQVLNYGHTIGHAIEKLSNYKLNHGQAVSIGMMAAGRIAILLGYFSEGELERQKQLLSRVGLPVKIPKQISDKEIIEVTQVDKKAKEGRAKYVLPVKIGKMNDFNGKYSTYVDKDIVMKALENTR